MTRTAVVVGGFYAALLLLLAAAIAQEFRASKRARHRNTALAPVAGVPYDQDAVVDWTLDKELVRLEAIVKGDLTALNSQLSAQSLPPIKDGARP